VPPTKNRLSLDGAVAHIVLWSLVIRQRRDYGCWISKTCLATNQLKKKAASITDPKMTQNVTLNLFQGLKYSE